MEQSDQIAIEEFRKVKTKEEVAAWLLQRNIPQKFCKIFEGEALLYNLCYNHANSCMYSMLFMFVIENYIDAQEFKNLTIEEVKSTISEIWIAKKICRHISQVCTIIFWLNCYLH